MLITGLLPSCNRVECPTCNSTCLVTVITANSSTATGQQETQQRPYRWGQNTKKVPGVCAFNGKCSSLDKDGKQYVRGVGMNDFCYEDGSKKICGVCCAEKKDDYR
jgi:hypothetical protein